MVADPQARQLMGNNTRTFCCCAAIWLRAMWIYFDMHASYVAEQEILTSMYVHAFILACTSADGITLPAVHHVACHCQVGVCI